MIPVSILRTLSHSSSSSSSSQIKSLFKSFQSSCLISTHVISFEDQNYLHLSNLSSQFLSYSTVPPTASTSASNSDAWRRLLDEDRLARRREKPPDSQKVPFKDRVRVRIRSGAGGEGMACFQRVGRGHYLVPDGGDGGMGGSVYFEASKDITSLEGVRPHAIASDGCPGRNNGQIGRGGSDVVVYVPLGTRITELRQVDPVADAAAAAAAAEAAKVALAAAAEKASEEKARQMELEKLFPAVSSKDYLQPWTAEYDEVMFAYLRDDRRGGEMREVGVEREELGWEMRERGENDGQVMDAVAFLTHTIRVVGDCGSGGAKTGAAKTGGLKTGGKGNEGKGEKGGREESWEGGGGEGWFKGAVQRVHADEEFDKEEGEKEEGEQEGEEEEEDYNCDPDLAAFAAAKEEERILEHETLDRARRYTRSKRSERGGDGKEGGGEEELLTADENTAKGIFAIHGSNTSGLRNDDGVSDPDNSNSIFLSDNDNNGDDSDNNSNDDDDDDDSDDGDNSDDNNGNNDNDNDHLRALHFEDEFEEREWRRSQRYYQVVQEVGTLEAHGQRVLVAGGGVGGSGNKRQAGEFYASRYLGDTSTRTASTTQTSYPAVHYDRDPGSPGESRIVDLEMKLLADVGLVGLPNAGKSSILSAVTASRAKVGSYAFTTQRPQLGVIEYASTGGGGGFVEVGREEEVRRKETMVKGDASINDNNFMHHSNASKGSSSYSSSSASSHREGQSSVQPTSTTHLRLADIPGLIGGASAGRGCGNTFLKHIERCRCLMYVIDLSGRPFDEIAPPIGGPGSSRMGKDQDQDQEQEQRQREEKEEEEENKGGGKNFARSEKKASMAMDCNESNTLPTAKMNLGHLFPLIPFKAVDQLKILQDELKEYNPSLLSLPAVVVANKVDAVPNPKAELAELKRQTDLPIVPISAARGLGLERLKRVLQALVPPMPVVELKMNKKKTRVVHNIIDDRM